MMDLGMSMEVELETDSSAGIGMMSKAGLGRTKHLDTKYLWVQQALRQKKFRVKKVALTV